MPGIASGGAPAFLGPSLSRTSLPSTVRSPHPVARVPKLPPNWPLKDSDKRSTAFPSVANHMEKSDPRPGDRQTMLPLSPRAASCVWMSAAMSAHFAGYECARSSALALFTSSESGFSSSSAYPLALGLVTPVSLVFLYGYGLLLKRGGPRAALRTTKLITMGTLGACILLLKIFEATNSAALLSKAVVGILFVCQNSYAHLLYTQQWSFLGSVMTPSEGTKWFSAIGGISSLVCTVSASLVHSMAGVIGLQGLIVCTCVAVGVSAILADQAYDLGEKNGFDPSASMQKKTSEKDEKSARRKSSSLLTETSALFQRQPTLAALFGEVIFFQSLSTVLNVCFVRQLKISVPQDTDRASFMGKFYACINAISSMFQFIAIPLARKYFEPKWVYRLMPLLLLPHLIYSAGQPSSLWAATGAFFLLKTIDYAARSVVNEMVFQPLDFESRYLGKEVIGVFANRFGKSGMSLILSLLAPFGLGLTQLSQLGVLLGGLWASSSYWLSRNVLSNKNAERLVQKRQQQSKCD